MKRNGQKTLLLLLVFFLSLSLAPFFFASADNQYRRAASELPIQLLSHKVEVIRDVWQDKLRQREVPAKIYYPVGLKGSAPVVIFSHGLGGSREGYEYLGKFWAENGLISIHLQHPGSDEEVWRGKKDPLTEMRKAAANIANATERAKDVSFALDTLEEINVREGPLKDLIDIQKIGLAGHSFGAHTTLLIAGQQMVWPGGRALSFADKRVKAAMPMSAPVPLNRRNLDKVYGAISIPCFHMTGTLDDSPIGETKAEERRIPFDHIKNSDQYLVIFKDGDHMIFSGRPRWTGIGGRGEKDEQFQEMIKKLSLVFWKAYLEGNKEAKKWLREGGAQKYLNGLASFEYK